MAVVIAASVITNSTAPGTWFTPAGTTFAVDVDVGTVQVQVRLDASDAVPKTLAHFSPTRATAVPAEIVAPSSVVIDTGVSGRQYRLVPVAGAATADAVE